MIHEIVQKRSSTSRRFVLPGNGRIELTSSSKRDSSSFSVDLATLSEFPEHSVSSGTHLNAEVIAGCIMILLFIGLPLAVGHSLAIFYLVGFVVFLLTLKKYRQLRQSKYSVFIYLHRNTGAPGLILHSDLPDEEAFRAFKSELEKQIKDAADRYGHPEITDSIAKQVTDLHHLFERGILSESELEAAKKRVLSNETDPRTIGFKVG